MKWKLYYGDGFTFCDEDGDWKDAPGLNAQALVVEDEGTGWTLEEGSDGWIQNYVWWPGADRPWGVDRYGTMDYLVAVFALAMGQTIDQLTMQEMIDAGVKLGRSIDTPRFEEIHQEAINDEYFPAKSARTRKERRG